MFDLVKAICKTCVVGIAYTRTKIGSDEMKRLCKIKCGRCKQEDKEDQPSLFDELIKEEDTSCIKVNKRNRLLNQQENSVSNV